MTSVLLGRPKSKLMYVMPARSNHVLTDLALLVNLMFEIR